MSARRRTVAAALAVAASASVLAGCGGGGDKSMVRVDALFDNASFAAKGQDVRIAGADVGAVKTVTLTKDRKARVEMEIEKRFLPLRQDADCSILPQSLIGERFVQCNPGKPSSPPIEKGGNPAPTVPVQNTNSPIDLDLIVDMLGAPVNTRLQLLFNEFGAAMSGRGDDLNQAIRRANPALTATRKTLDVVEANRAAVNRLLKSTNQVLTALDDSKRDLNGTFDQGARFLKVTSDYKAALDETIRELPPTLSTLRPTLTDLRNLVSDANPTLAALRTSAPKLRELAGDLGPLSDAARPALRRIASTSRLAEPILRRASPQLARVRQVANATQPLVPKAKQLVKSLVDQGFVENLALTVHYGTLVVARYDARGHNAAALPAITPCLLLRRGPTQPECNANFNAPGGGAVLTRSKIKQGFDRMLQSPPKAEPSKAVTRAVDQVEKDQDDSTGGAR